MLRIRLVFDCDLCRQRITETEVPVSDDVAEWIDVARDLAAAADEKGVKQKYLCTPCVMNIDCGVVCIIP